MEYIINDCTDPYFNLALEEYLFNAEDQITYFWLWQNDNTIVIGKNQNAFREIKDDFVRENGIKVSRRITGGGAVYHDLGNINFTFIVPSSESRNYDFQRFTDQIAQALKTFGLQAEYSGRNDLLLAGKKFSGNAQFVGKAKTLHHGTLMFSSDAAIIEQCLNPAPEKLKAHGVGSVKSRVTTIAEHLPKKISLADFKNELAKRICEAYDQVNIRPLTENEMAEVKNLRDKKFASYEWIYGASPEFNYSKTIRFEGCGAINLSLSLSKSNTVENCKITGDFFGSGDVHELEELLKGQKCTKDSILTAIENVDLRYYFGGLEKADFLLLFEEPTSTSNT
jgi:lipoate-protein ligase A